MALISESFKDIVNIKFKSRDDDLTDQFSRIFVVKMLIMSALVTSLDFFNDEMACIRPTNSKVEDRYVQSLCWIQGFYIYKDVHGHIDEFHAYGMPRDPDKDGMTTRSRSLCEHTSSQHQRNDDCVPLTRMYFTQYQYMPFYIASLAVLYYIPYVLFRAVNSDVIALKKDVTPAGKDADTSKGAVHITNNYFKYSTNGGIWGLRTRVFFHGIVKLLYLVVNICGVWFTNKILNYRYTNYGMEWIRWSQLNNTMAYRFTDSTNHLLTPKPGDYLLPSVGFCDVVEGYQDNLDVHNNKYKTICEISPHVLYQYVLLVLWFVFACGIVVSLTGVTTEIISLITINARAVMTRGKWRMSVYDGCEHLTFREIQYLTLIRKKNDIMYREIVSLVRRDKSV